MTILMQPPTIRSFSQREQGQEVKNPTVQLNWKLPKGFTIPYSVNCILPFIFMKVNVFMHGSTIEKFVQCSRAYRTKN